MNAVRSTACRLYQGAFRVALPLLPYREPLRLRGLAPMASLLDGQVRRALVVTDPGLVAAGVAARVTDALDAAHVPWELFSDVGPNPTVSQVELARSAFLGANCDCIVAVGGGSAMDCAKACAARVVRPSRSVREMRGLLRVGRETPLLVAVPTTAGTGSETTLAAVVCDPDSNEKFAINDFNLIPDVAVHDWSLTESLPPHLTATTGLDALTHAVEAYIGRSTTAYTRSMAVRAVRLIDESLRRACDDGSDRAAREAMLEASWCAGNAFTRSYVGYVHGLAHALGGRYGTPHGLANAVVLPYVLDAYGPAAYGRLASLARESAVVPRGLSDAVTAKAFVAWVRSLCDSLSIPRHLAVPEGDVRALAAHADRECNPLYPVPRLMDAAELAGILEVVAGREEPSAAGLPGDPAIWVPSAPARL